VPAGCSHEARVAAYKAILRACIDRRPSGLRLKIAGALGKHKSFVSQITNPAYAVPIPARHIGPILEICRLSRQERETFLSAYRAAHPGPAPPRHKAATPRARSRALRIEVPVLEDAGRQRQLEELIREVARRVIALARSS
jgi:hypothetical protein